ncbi:MAG: efflux RND transporter periplasmic adaptor subunit [Chloroflexota bacterium]
MKKYRTLIIIAAVVVVVVAAILVVGRIQANSQQSSYETTIAERGNLTAIMGATGSVRANQTAVLVWQTSGTVETVLREPGERVLAGDVLATLGPWSLGQNVILAQADLINAENTLENLLNSQTARAQAQLALVNAQRSYDSALANYRNFVSNGRATQGTIDNAEAQYVLAQQMVDQLQTAYNNVANLDEDDLRRATAYSNLYAAMQSRDRALATYNWYMGRPTDIDLAEYEAKLAIAEAQLQDAQREWERLQDGPDPDDIQVAQARIDASRATANQTRLTAPFDGTVTQAFPLPGDQVSPGITGFRIDDLTHLLVDVQVSEVDINNIAVRQPVSISFDAILGLVYNGVVIEVDRVGTVVQGVVNFNVIVELTDADDLVKPGMTAAVTIIVRQLDDVLLVPNRAVRLAEGERVVYVLRNGEVVRVAITLGASSDLVSEVIAGELREGDEIILNPPTEFSHNGGPPAFMGR